MTSEHEAAEGPKDRTKLIWLGVGVMFMGMITLLWLGGTVESGDTWVRASHILIMVDGADAAEALRAQETITGLRERIMNGESFKKLAAEYSDDPGSASRGGYLGQSSRNDYVKAFENYIWSAPLEELSEVIQTQLGYHLIIVHDLHISDAERWEMELDQRVREQVERESEQQ